MDISVLVLGSPFDSQSAYTALKYCEAAADMKLSLKRVFFYQSGIHNGTDLACPPQDEFDIQSAWSTLKQTSNVELIVCIAAAARRGLIDSTEAERHSKNTFNLSEDFELSGLGQLVEAQATSDRFIVFGR